MKQYPITFWFGIPKSFLSRERILEAKACGFNIIECPYDPETNLQVLQWCEELELRAIVYDRALGDALSQSDGWEEGLRRMADTYRDCPALLWYHLKDEPNDGDFPVLGKIAAFMRECDPLHPVYINLLPCITSAVARGVTIEESIRMYHDYVRNFLDTVKPAMLSWDMYGFRKREVERLGDLPEAALSPECRANENLEGKLFEEWDYPGFFENLEITRRYGKEYGIPMMNIILLTEHWFYRLLGEAELRWEAFHSLAYGVDYLSYFTYWTPMVTGEPWSYYHGIINADGTKDAHYGMVQAINREIGAIGAAVQGKESTAVFHVGPETENVTPFAPFAGIDSVKADRLTLGFFDDDAVVIVNKDFHASQTISLATEKKLTILDKSDMTYRPLTAENGAYTITLAAGDGELIMIG